MENPTNRKIEFLAEFSDKVKNYRTVLLEADVTNSPTSDTLKAEMDAFADNLADSMEIGQINSLPAIAATRAAYKACGKDPNRYRPSQEQMMRRIVRRLGLYNVNSIVDAGNLFSLSTGCSVGCFDAAKIDGDTLFLGVGHENEPYEGIGRGPLNIAGLPVFRDSTGGVGTPTSDNERTKVGLDTKSIVVTVHLFDPGIDAGEVERLFADIFTRHCGARNIRATVWRP